MLFYHVENKDHIGPYFASNDIVGFLIQKGVIECGWDNKYLCNHPTPRNNEILAPIWNELRNSEDFLFGFESLEKVFS